MTGSWLSPESAALELGSGPSLQELRRVASTVTSHLPCGLFCILNEMMNTELTSAWLMVGSINGTTLSSQSDFLQINRILSAKTLNWILQAPSQR